MVQWLLSLPKATFVLLVISSGIIAIILLNPPHTICDSQLDLFRNSQTGFLYPNPKSKLVKTTEVSLLIDKCKVTNSPGGCMELFQKVNRLVEDLNDVPDECNIAVGGDPKVKDAVWKILDLMILISWGSKPPKTYYEKFGWLEVSDMALFCRLKTLALSMYGEPAFQGFREKYFTQLPGAEGLSREAVWDATILSENCKRYP